MCMQSDLVKPSEEEEGQLNFQRASMSLDAGVKIYSHRVDSVHTVAFRMLCGLGRPGSGPALDASQDDPEQGQLLNQEKCDDDLEKKYDDDLERKVSDKAGASSMLGVAIWTMINVVSTVSIVSALRCYTSILY